MVELLVQDLSSTIALIAGNGWFPKEFLDNAQKAGVTVKILAHYGETSPEIVANHECVWIRVGEVGKILRTLRRWKVTQVAFLGGIRRPQLFRTARPDFKGLALIARAGSIRDDIILRAIAEEIESIGVQVISPACLLPQSVAKEGCLTKRFPSLPEMKDALFGWEAALQMGRFDIGQTLLIHDGVVIAVEAVEGTDATILRAKDLSPKGSIVIKLPKIQQDLRLDLPSLGLTTVENMVKSNSTALFLQSEKAFLLDPVEMIKRANEANLTISVWDSYESLKNEIVSVG